MAPLADDDPDKWDYTLHTGVKHEILTKYIDGWIRIAGSFRQMYYYDCFAGKGEYNQGQLGSPIIVMQYMQKHAAKGIDFNCVCIEKNKNNHDNLMAVCNREKVNFPGVNFEIHNESFEELITRIPESLNSRNDYPSFFFIDPFGIKVPFKIVSSLCKYDHSEVLVTFMSKNMARFLESNRHTGAIEETLGSSFDQSILDLDLEERQQALVDIYKTNLKNHAKYVMSYRLKESTTNITTYHLIHGSNHFEAFKLMKDILYNQGAEGTFTFHGPKENILGKGQTRLTEPTEENEFREWLIQECAGKTLRFWDIMKETYERTKFIEKHYRAAIQQLAKDQTIALVGQGSRGGINRDTLIKFPSNPNVQKTLF